MTSALSEVIIADRLTDANPVRLLTSGLQVSWEISRAGQLSFDIPYQDLVALGISSVGDLLGRWIHYTHPTAGPWGGQITGLDGDSTGVILVSAESWASCLRGVFGGSNPGGSAAQQIQTLIDGNVAWTGVKRGTVDVLGPVCKMR